MSRPPRTRASVVNTEPAVARAFDQLLASLGSDASRVGYEKDWVTFRQWLVKEKLDVLKVEADDVQRYVNALMAKGKSKGTRGRALSVLREVYRALVVKRLLDANPAREAKNPKHGGKKRTPWLDEAELGKMLAYRGDSWRAGRDRLIIQLLAGLGWRRREVAAMRVGDFSRGQVTGEVKGGKPLTSTVAPWLQREVSAWVKYAGLGSRSALLPRSEKNTEAISGEIAYNVVKQVAAEVGVDVERATPHALRRSLATLARMRGVPLEDIQHSLGHASIQTTERYLKDSAVVEHAPGEWMGELVKDK